MRIFVDTDVCIDVLVNRAPFHQPAERIFSLAAKKKITAAVSALTFANAEHVLRMRYKLRDSRAILSSFKPVVTVLPITEKVIALSLASDFSDFEDAIQYHTAAEAGIDILVTRNVGDYKKAKIQIMTPESFLARM